MEAKGGRDQIDQRRFVRNLAVAKQAGSADVASASMRFDAAPMEGFWSRLKRIMLGVSAS